jgi:hypothetical protein
MLRVGCFPYQAVSSPKQSSRWTRSYFSLMNSIYPSLSGSGLLTIGSFPQASNPPRKPVDCP